MRTREIIKRGHEKAVADQLFDALKIQASFEKNGDPDKREPDVLYRVGARTLGIEIATAYYENSDARDEWTLTAGERVFSPKGYEMRSGGLLKNPDDRICERVQQEIYDKCGKRYMGADEFWLCIEQRAPLSEDTSIRECVESLTVPEGHQFTRLYLTYLSESGTYTAIRIA